MKKLFTILAMLVAMNASAQWQPDVRLTNNDSVSFTSSNNAWCVASSGAVVHVVWVDGRDGNAEIYYKRSTDAGINWGTDIRFTNNTASSVGPSVAVSGSVVHVVWMDNRDGNYEIYYKRSLNAGVNWGADTRLTNNTFDLMLPSVSISGSIVNVVWMVNRDGNYKIYNKRSTDAGENWGADTRLTNNSAFSGYPSVSVSGSVVHVVWVDNRDENYEIYYKCSTDAGISWGADIRLTNYTANSVYPSVAVSGSVVHVVWDDGRNENEEIYYKNSTDAGVSWGADTRLTNSTNYSEKPSVTISGSVMHVVWKDNRDGYEEIYYKRSTDAGVSWEADIRLTNNSGVSGNSSVAVSGSVVHVVWMDMRDGNQEIYYKRNPTGNPNEIQNISTETPSKYSLGQNYPNPFNPMCNVQFTMFNAGNVRLVVYDIMGREVQTLVNEKLSAGTYEVKFDGSALTSGIYFYKLVTEGFTETKKMLLIK